MRLTILLLIIAGFGTSAVFAQSNIEIQTDKPVYDREEFITLVGKVQPFISDVPVLTKLLDHNGGLLQIWQEIPAEDGSFTIQIKQADSWDVSSPLSIQSSYGNSKTRIQFVIVEAQVMKDVSDIQEVVAGSLGTFDLEYTINGGTITDARARFDELSLDIDINVEKEGVLEISIPNSAMVSQDHTGKDIPYIVLVDGFQVDIEEKAPKGADRILIIPFTDESQRVQIIGTYIIPEFGTTSIMVLLIAIIASVIVVNRTKII